MSIRDFVDRLPDEPARGGGGFLKLSPGDEVEIVVCAPPMARVKQWDDGPRETRLVPVYNLGSKTVQILDASFTLWGGIRKQLEKAAKKGRVAVVEVEREGSGKTTKWLVSGGRADEAQEAAAEAAWTEAAEATRESMAHFGGVALGVDPPGAAAGGSDDDVPF
jgi:hypothetical protein